MKILDPSLSHQGVGRSSFNMTVENDGSIVPSQIASIIGFHYFLTLIAGTTKGKRKRTTQREREREVVRGIGLTSTCILEKNA